MTVAPTQRVMHRIDFIDVAKAAGIVLVVLAHAPGAPADVVRLIYSFHMPLFFFISGYLLSVEAHRTTFCKTAERAARSLLVPYLFFFVLSFLYWLATRHLGARAAKFAGVDAGDALVGLATGVSSDLFVNMTLWFFPCLFVCKLIHAGARRWLSPRALFIGTTLLATLLLVATVPWTHRLPWGLDIAWIALAFYSAGHALRMSDRVRTSWVEWVGVAAPVLLGTLWLGLVSLQGRVDLAQANFGDQPVLYLPCAAAGIGLVLVLVRRCPSNPAVRWLADNSLVIFPLHPLLINAASGAVQLSGLKPLADRHSMVWCLLATGWGLVASVPLAWLLRRHLPFGLGLRPMVLTAGPR